MCAEFPAVDSTLDPLRQTLAAFDGGFGEHVEMLYAVVGDHDCTCLSTGNCGNDSSGGFSNCFDLMPEFNICGNMTVCC